MKIDKDSWHYKYQSNRFFSDRGFCPAYSLCPYVRHLIRCILLDFVVWGFIGIILFLMSFPVVGLFIENGYSCNFAGVVVGLVVWSIALIPVLAIGYDDFLKPKVKRFIKTTFKSEYKEPKPKEPSIIVEYFKALHNKMCPTLEFVDKEDK